MNKTIALCYWKDKDDHLIPNPWTSRDQAYIKHEHLHTTWARNIHFNHKTKSLKKPALFNWEDKRIYIVGRGIVNKHNEQVLNTKRKETAIFLNHSFINYNQQKQDYIMLADSRIINTIPDFLYKKVSIPRNLITFPGIDTRILKKSWRTKLGFTYWNKAPLNDWMRELFPKLPQLLETLTCAVPALHLAAISGAKEIVCIGMTYIFKNGELTFKDINNNTVRTKLDYAKMAMATTCMAVFINNHTNCTVYNAETTGLLGINLYSKEKELQIIKSLTL